MSSRNKFWNCGLVSSDKNQTRNAIFCEHDGKP